MWSPTHWALPVHTTFSDRDHTSLSQQCQTVLTETYIHVRIRLSWDFIGLSTTSSRSGIYHLFWWSCLFKGENWCSSSLFRNRTFNIGFFSDSLKARSLKLCIVITLLGSTLSFCFLGFMILALFQGHRFVRNVNCTWHVLDSCPL